MRRAGARLVEVGTTNRTRVADFEAALAEGRAKLVLRVHPSNFAQTGFVEAPDAAELAAVAHQHGAIVVDDLGSGALLDTARFGLAHEPTPRERLAAGADLVTFSGDKLVGGPQAGIVAGRGSLIERLRRDPLARAMRPDKVILAALAATLRLYRAGVAATTIPIWRQIATPADELERRATGVLAALAADPSLACDTGGRPRGLRCCHRGRPHRIHDRRWIAARPDGSVVGTGDRRPAAAGAARRASSGTRPSSAVWSTRSCMLDLRTVEPADDDLLAEAVRAALIALRRYSTAAR